MNLKTISLKNKIYFTTIFVILFVSAAIAFLARWILVSSLSSELEQRGIAIAHSIAEQGRSHILDKDNPSLVSLVFETAHLGERKSLVAYIFIEDKDDNILAHTFTRPFPTFLRHANHVPEDQTHSISLLSLDQNTAYDIAVPVVEGIYRIATVHVGLNKGHIDQLIGKLRITFLGFISAIVILIFLISHRLSRYITRPISMLTRVSDEISRGNFDIQPDPDGNAPLWESQKCPAYKKTKLPCWHYDQSIESERGTLSEESGRICEECKFYHNEQGDELTQLADSFSKMIWSIKLYRQKLRESEEKYRSLFDSGPDPVMVIDYHSSEVLAANPRAEELYGYNRHELTGRRFTEIFPEYVETVIRPLEEDGSATQCVYCPKVLHYKKGRQPFYVNAHACPISYKGTQAIILACNDITEMIEKDAQLIQASKMKTLGEMSAGIAHELNQPLNAIKMGSDFLGMMTQEGSTIPRESLHQVVNEISTQVDRATEIINTLRAFGKKADFIKEHLDLNRSIKGVLRIIGQQLKLQNVDVTLDLQEQLPPILAHDNRLQQVLFNLMTNAMDAISSKEYGERNITIRSYASNGQVFVDVKDTGIGIPKEALDKIFEPFFTTKATGQGMGLGLSITYGIVKDYHGKIDIRSQEGEGTTFTLSFPASMPANERITRNAENPRYR
ncbi:MAG: ATP-binding protein [Desulfovibrionales bacterium]